MERRQSRIDEIKNEPYDPELVWNVEGPLRKKTDAAVKKAKTDKMLMVNETQKEGFYSRKQAERDFDLSEGKRLV